jgi:hypothetical protein
MEMCLYEQGPKISDVSTNGSSIRAHQSQVPVTAAVPSIPLPVAAGSSQDDRTEPAAIGSYRQLSAAIGSENIFSEGSWLLPTQLHWIYDRLEYVLRRHSVISLHSYLLTPSSYLLTPSSWLLAPGSWLLAPAFCPPQSTSRFSMA